MVAERPHEDLAAFAGQDPFDVAPAVAQVVKDVREFGAQVAGPG